MRSLHRLILLLGLTFLAAQPASAAARLQTEKVASGSAAVLENLIGENSPLSAERTGENLVLGYDFASGSPVAAKAGATIFKSAHYATRLEKAGVNVARAESAVAKEVGAMRGSMDVGADVAGRMRIDNVLVEYRARLLPDGSVNVGTIFPVKP